MLNGNSLLLLFVTTLLVYSTVQLHTWSQDMSTNIKEQKYVYIYIYINWYEERAYLIAFCFQKQHEHGNSMGI